MFNIGGPELIVIALVALIVLGPDKLPGALRTAGQLMGELKKISSGFQTDLRTAIADAEREADEAQATKSQANPNVVDNGVEAGRIAARAELDALGLDVEAESSSGGAESPDAGDDIAEN